MHDCYRCGQACYCHGDIDDCQVEDEEYAYMNCEGCGAADCVDDDDEPAMSNYGGNEEQSK